MRLDDAAEYYLLTEQELKILLAGTDHAFLFGLLTENAVKNDEDRGTVITALANMAKYNKIVSDGTRFRISVPIGELVSRIGSAQAVLISRFPGSVLPVCCYCGDPCVVCERVPYQAETLRLKFCSPAELARTFASSAKPTAQPLPDAALSEDQLWAQGQPQPFSAELYIGRKPALTVSVDAVPNGAPEIRITYADRRTQTLAFDERTLENKLLAYLSYTGEQAQERILE